MSKFETNDKHGADSQVDGYWQDVENKVLDPKATDKEFADGEFDSFSVEKSRRSFLKIMGFSVTALPLAGCVKIPVKKAIPYLMKNDTVIPGVSNWYGSTFKGTPILVKTREGRPIKIEGNDKSTFTMGGTGSQTQASVLSLYDSNRLNSPLVDNVNVEWSDFDMKLKKNLDAAKESGKDIFIVTPSFSSPSEMARLKEFSKNYGAKHIAYDGTSNFAQVKANSMSFNAIAATEYSFDKADLILSFGADFLATWGNDTAFTKQYSSRRDPAHELGMSRHIQIEPIMTLTGSNADFRHTKSQKNSRNILLGVLKGITGEGDTKVSAENSDIVANLVKELKANIGKSLVVSNDTDINAQVVINKINLALGNYGKTLSVVSSEHSAYADDAAFEELVNSMNSGNVAATLMIGVNPAYTFHDSDKFAKAYAKVPTRVSFALSNDETSTLSNFNATSNHTYEAWSDTLVSSTEISFTQPVIQPLFGSRMYTETLMSLTGLSGSFYEYMQAFWAKNLYGKSSGFNTAVDFWNKSLHDGVVTLEGLTQKVSASSFNATASARALNNVSYKSGLHIVTYQKSGIKDGDMANNPWLQELPDPITKATWDNYAMVSPAYAKANDIKSGDMVELKSNTHSIKVPAIVQPGTEKNTVAIAVGYGRKVAGKVAKNLGANAFNFNTFANGATQTASSFGTIAKTGKFKGLAQTQTHQYMEGRDIVREATAADYSKDPKAGNHKKAKLVNIYPADHSKEGHQWAMAIDLTKCTGCSSCVISCNAENNVSVVGRKEVANRRDMHWLRLDRYYKGDDAQPEVMHMPMLCQHCENAPCENVCPVMATVHSSDGINQQIYNRCVGTRYCANNCPYKVRRFNWFNYDRSDKMANMVLNPDVSQRTRGIMEKCSLCIQRIQDGKLTAKRERRLLKDGDIKVACQQSCPADGIVFGDMNDKDSKIAKYLGHERNYTVLEELNVRPRVSYLTKIRNK
jgi:molybdopterin-containing oxidoreductase family iron-sulfur binding subunit